MPYGFGQVLNGIAYNALVKNPMIPDFRCMVGTAERLDPLPILIPQWTPSETVPNVEPIKNMKYETSANKLQEKSLTEEDFKGTGVYLGKAVGGG